MGDTCSICHVYANIESSRETVTAKRNKEKSPRRFEAIVSGHQSITQGCALIQESRFQTFKVFIAIVKEM